MLVAICGFVFINDVDVAHVVVVIAFVDVVVVAATIVALILD